MYTEQDYTDISRRTRNSWIGTGVAVALLLAPYVYALAARVKWLAYAAGALMFVAAAYGVIAHITPNMRYQRFLKDMQIGGSHEMTGVVLSVDSEETLQDGVRVQQVRLMLDAEDGHAPRTTASVAAARLEQKQKQAEDERILYLNASKAANFPPVGARVKLRCFGRHIIECAVVGMGVA